LIAYFLGNIYAKNCSNRTAYVKIITSCKGETFFETQRTIQNSTNHFTLILFLGPMILTSYRLHFPLYCFCPLFPATAFLPNVAHWS